MMGCVYVIHALTTNYYKIGITRHKIRDRMSGLRAAYPFWHLDLVVTHWHEEYRRIENLLHKRYTKERLKNSEWFELTNEDLSFLKMDTDDLVDSIGIRERITIEDAPQVDIHEFFSNQPDEDEAIPVAIEPIVQTPECARLRMRLEHLHDNLGLTWRDIGHMEEFNGASFGTLNAIYHGREPKSQDTQRKLGLPIIEMVPRVIADDN